MAQNTESEWRCEAIVRKVGTFFRLFLFTKSLNFFPMHYCVRHTEVHIPEAPSCVALFGKYFRNMNLRHMVADMTSCCTDTCYGRNNKISLFVCQNLESLCCQENKRKVIQTDNTYMNCN